MDRVRCLTSKSFLYLTSNKGSTGNIISLVCWGGIGFFGGHVKDGGAHWQLNLMLPGAGERQKSWGVALSLYHCFIWFHLGYYVQSKYMYFFSDLIDISMCLLCIKKRE